MNPFLVDLLRVGVPALVAALFVVLTATCEIGFRVGRWRLRRTGGDTRVHASTAALTAAMLGLMTFMLGLSINAAQSRFEARRDLVVAEANAIGTAWLRSRIVEGPDGETLSSQIRDYARARLAFTRAQRGPEVAAVTARTDADQAAIWTTASRVARLAPNAMSAALINAINAMFDSSMSQRFAFVSEPPNGMIDIMIFGSVLAVGAMGFEMGLSGARQRILSSLLILMWSGVMLMTIDLTRPRVGDVRVDVRPLEWTIQGMESPPAAP